MNKTHTFYSIPSPSHPTLSPNSTQFLTFKLPQGLQSWGLGTVASLPSSPSLTPISDETREERANMEGPGLLLVIRRRTNKKGQSRPPCSFREPPPHCFPAGPPALPAHLLVRVHVDVALDALLPHVGPGVPTHPFSLALGTLVLAEAALFALVWGQTLAFGACLGDSKQTQGLESTRPKCCPHGVPTVSLFSFHTLCP